MNLAAAAAATLSTLANLIFYILDTSSSPILLRLGSEGGTTILEHLDTKNLDRCGTSLLDEGRGDKIMYIILKLNFIIYKVKKVLLV